MDYVGPEHFIKNLRGFPLVDVRSPAEYLHGHISGAINIPIFSNEERAVVGTAYKQQGRIDAIEKGLEIVGPKMKALKDQAKGIAADGKLRLYCWRGGMRSEKMAWLFELVGIPCIILEGGIKAYRNFLMADFERINRLIVLQGATGTGKTEILRFLKDLGEQVLDLEGLANHRGSAFGDIGLGKQPTSQQFQNDLHKELTFMDPGKRIWVESESLTIGKVYLPETLWEKMNNSRIIELTIPRERRIRRLVDEYGVFSKEILGQATLKIQKRFGGNRVKEVMECLENGDLRCAARILLDYYDKSYSFSQNKYKNNVPVRIKSESGDARQNALLVKKKADEII